MSKNEAIDIFLRVRPTSDPFKGFKISQEDGKVQFQLKKNQDQGYVNNKQEKKTFQFNQIFGMQTKQEKIFDKIAKDVADSALDGYNGTIFAYGQTGSGKTFTMTGSGTLYQDRGLISRTLSYIFHQKQKRGDRMSIFVSYMQIYQAHGYDLIVAQENMTKNVLDLPRVEPRQGANGQMILKNLSRRQVLSLQDAMNLLFIGDTNRQVCKTPKNDESTRSHCIFIIHLQIAKPGSDIRTQSTIHLVDLSGSQRIKQTGVEGKLQRQAITINLGLHYLQRVIVCLNKKAKGQNIHIPYRQSLMTTVLRDSIGGNCKTRMIATMSAKPEDILQSISTCKFAMRVALIKNDLQRNETVDPGIIIARLKQQNAQLKAELALIKGQDVKEELDKYDIQQCRKMVDDYIKNQDPSAAIILTDRLKINECFYYLKSIVKKGGISIANLSSVKVKEGNVMSQNKSILNYSEEDNSRQTDQVKRLKLLVQQKDNQIALLLTLISKKKGNDGSETVVKVKRDKEQEDLIKSVVKQKPFIFKQQEQVNKIQQSTISMKKNQVSRFTQQKSILSNSKISLQASQIQKMLIKPVQLSSEQLLDNARAFQQFRRAYRKHQAMQKNRELINQKKAKGSQIGKIVNDARNSINILKGQLQQLKRNNAVNSLVQGKQIEDPQQEAIRNRMLQLKEVYKTNYQQLKVLKMQVENIERVQKNNFAQLEQDFHKWVLFKQKEREGMVQQIDSSLLKSNIKDVQVNKHLESFFKAQNQIRKR